MKHIHPPDSISKVAVIGLGYVGLPLALQFARSGYKTLGVDTDGIKVDSLNHGRSYLHHIPDTLIHEQIDSGHFSATTNFSLLKDVGAIIICVPTPLNKNREPDLSFVLATGRSIGNHLRPEQLIVLESSTFPGTTEGELRQVLEGASGLTAGRDFHLAYSPEREDPGNPNSQVAMIPKIVGGLTPECLALAMSLYRRVIKTIVPVSSCRAAEATKLLENIFRSVNIALINELKMVYTAMEIDVWEIIAAAKTKPFGFMPFYPGPGLGGHCIPIDPFYLTWKAREFGLATKFIELAGEINTQMPIWVTSRAAEALNGVKKTVNGSRILIVGLAYKANVDDDRESPSYVIMEILKQHGAEVDYYDPYIPVIRPSRKYASLAGTQSVTWSGAKLKSYDCAIVATAHTQVDHADLLTWIPLIIDTRNALVDTLSRPGQVWKA